MHQDLEGSLVHRAPPVSVLRLNKEANLNWILDCAYFQFPISKLNFFLLFFFLAEDCTRRGYHAYCKNTWGEATISSGTLFLRRRGLGTGGKLKNMVQSGRECSRVRITRIDRSPPPLTTLHHSLDEVLLCEECDMAGHDFAVHPAMAHKHVCAECKQGRSLG